MDGVAYKSMVIEAVIVKSVELPAMKTVVVTVAFLALVAAQDKASTEMRIYGNNDNSETRAADLEAFHKDVSSWTVLNTQYVHAFRLSRTCTR